MNLQSLASHTIDVDLLPETPVVLDVGCRWFDFSTAMIAHRPKARIIAMDPSSDVTLDDGSLPLKNHKPFLFIDAALIGGDELDVWFGEGIAGDGGGNLVVSTPAYGDYRVRRIPSRNIGYIMQHTCLGPIEHFDAVKLDCEGSEFGILENWPGPIATQISVEFHDWTGPWKQHGCDRAINRLQAMGYKTVQHALSKQGTGLGHWDSLFVLGQ